jgi:hypothetical protein
VTVQSYKAKQKGIFSFNNDVTEKYNSTDDLVYPLLSALKDGYKLLERVDMKSHSSYPHIKRSRRTSKIPARTQLDIKQ